jgi:carbamoyltransferase
MIFTFPVKKEYAEKIPAVVHVDRTARPQAVYKDTNPRYWGLINEFYKITGIPLILNTSFNVQEPVVCTPKDAINTFLKTKVDYLVIEDFIAKLPK